MANGDTESVRWRKRRAEQPGDTQDIFLDLRSRALELDPKSVGIEPSAAHPAVWGALMEIGISEGIATVMTLADGTTSLYTSTGGGTIGAGEHESVARQTHAFLQTVEEHLDGFRAQEPMLPSAGEVHFQAMTYSGSLGATVSEDQLGAGDHPLSRVFYAGHDVISAIRELDE